MKKSFLNWLGIAATAGTTVWGQVVYINDPNVAGVVVGPNPENLGFRYRLNTAGGGTDVLMAYQGLFSNSTAQVGWDPPAASATPVSFVIENRPGEGITFFAQVGSGDSPLYGAAAWGSNFDPALTVRPPEFPAGTIPLGNIQSAATLQASASGATATPDVLSYNSFSLAFSASTFATAGRTASITWNNLQFSAPGFSQSGTGIADGSLSVVGAQSLQTDQQAIYSNQLLQNVPWKLTGDVTIARTGFTSTAAISMTIRTQNATFTVVPEPEEYAAAFGGVLLVAGLWLRQRRTGK